MSSQSSLSSARRTLGLAGFIALSLVAASASAGDCAVAQKTVQKTVRYADLNLDKSADAVRLYERLGNAAKAVCASYSNRDITSRRMRRACEREALSNAVEELQNPAVTALHSSEDGERIAQQRTDAQPRS